MKKTIGENLRILRLRNSLSMQEAGKRLGLSAPGLLKYERNQISPSFEKLEKFAEVYNTTINEIMDTEQYNEIKFNNLKLESNITSVKEEKIKNILRKKIDNYFEILSISDKKLQNKFGVHIINTLEEAESLATKLRIFFTIPVDAPISNLIYLLESHDMMIITIPQSKDTEGFIGFYETINNVPIIAVPESSNGYEQRYNVAKYLGELLMVSYNNKDAFTTRFALSLLIPRQSLINEFGEFRNKIEQKEIEIYSRIYNVSYKNIIKRLQMCEIITQSNAKYLNININKNDLHEQIYTEQANNYEKMLYKLIAQGSLKEPERFK